MKEIIKIAFRNLREHKAKTLIIGILVGLGIAVMVLGNSALESADKGMRKTFIENYTGHLLVSKKLESGKMTVFGVQAMMDIPENVTVPHYREVYQYLQEIPEVETVMAQNSNFMPSFIRFDEEMKEGAQLHLWGIDADSYKEMFPDNIEIVKGEFLKTDERGFLLNEAIYEDIKEELDRDLQIGDMITIQGFAYGLKIIEVPLTGIYRYKNADSTVNEFNLIDVESFRILHKMIVGTTAAVEVDDEAVEFLDDELDLDSLFDDTEEVEISEDTAEKDYDAVLGDLSVREALTRPDTGAWNYILLRLKDSDDVYKVRENINKWAEEKGYELEVVPWTESSGMIGQILTGLKLVFNIIILLVAIVAIIIIMNTLVVSIVERTSEIGTMRAIGGQKDFIRTMFVTETMTISLVFGLIGIAVAAIILLIAGQVGIDSGGNEIFESLFGGPVLYPSISPLSIVLALVVCIFIGFVSSLYPVYLALKIEPVEAMQSN